MEIKPNKFEKSILDYIIGLILDRKKIARNEVEGIELTIRKKKDAKKIRKN